MADTSTTGHETPESFEVRILRQDAPGQTSYWERHRVKYESDMNVISVLQRIAAQAETVDGKSVAPVAWDCNCLEEVCGACTMLVNGRTRQSCSASLPFQLARLIRKQALTIDVVREGSDSRVPIGWLALRGAISPRK